MRAIICTVIATLMLVSPSAISGQGPTRTLVAVWAHADDEAPVAPVLARYARDGVQVHMIIVTDGAQGAANTSVPRGPEIAKLRAEEARCSAQALGVQPPILLGFPDGAIGAYSGDPTLLFRLTQRVHEGCSDCDLMPHHLGTRRRLWSSRSSNHQQRRHTARTCGRARRSAATVLRVDPGRRVSGDESRPRRASRLSFRKPACSRCGCASPIPMWKLRADRWRARRNTRMKQSNV